MGKRNIIAENDQSSPKTTMLFPKYKPDFLFNFAQLCSRYTTELGTLQFQIISRLIPTYTGLNPPECFLRYLVINIMLICIGYSTLR